MANNTVGGLLRRQWGWILFVVVLLVFSGTAIFGGQLGWLPQHSDFESAFVFGAGAIALFVLWLFISDIRGTPTFKHIFKGEDGRASTSKFQFFVWSAAVIYAYVSLFAARAYRGNEDAISDIPRNLLIAMGLSIGGAIGAKAITQTKSDNNLIVKSDPAPEDVASARFLVSDDKGDPDIAKIQLLAWTFVAVGVFLLNTWDQIGKVLFLHSGLDLNATCANQGLPEAALRGCGVLPNIDDSLMILMGLGTGAYLGTKLVSASSPMITSIAPAVGDQSTTIILNGQSFGATQNGSQVLIDDRPAAIVPQPPAADQQFWSDTQISFKLPPRHPDGREWNQLRAGQVAAPVIYFSVVAGGQTSNKYPFTYAPALSIAPDAALDPGKVGLRYDSQPLPILGGVPPFRWSTADPLPADLGITLNPDTGVISGIPLRPITLLITLQVTDSLQQVATRVVSLTIVP